MIEPSLGDLLTEQLDRLLTASCSRAVLDAAEAGTWAADLWTQVELLGLPSAVASETAGGHGLSWSDMAGVLEALGYHAAPIPLGETMIAAWLLGLAEMEIPEGPLVLEPRPLTLMDGRLHGPGDPAAWPGQGQWAVAVCADGPHLRIALAPIPACLDAPAIGRDTRGRMIWDGIAPAKLSPPLPGLSKDGALPALAVIRSAQIAGALNRCLELSLDYAGLRNQFGRPIGKFQAVQQMAAKLALETAAAKAAADFGLRALQASPILAAGSAKTRASRAAGLGAALAHQIHGAIGVTEEHALQLYTRRLWQWRDEAGSEHQWSERLGRHAMDYGAQGLWAGLIDELDRTGDVSNG